MYMYIEIRAVFYYALCIAYMYMYIFLSAVTNAYFFPSCLYMYWPLLCVNTRALLTCTCTCLLTFFRLLAPAMYNNIILYNVHVHATEPV